MEYLNKAGIILRQDEIDNMEVADFGLDEPEKTGLEVVVYVNTENKRPSATVGEDIRRSDRMKAGGLNEKGLEEYYQSRNLLKVRVTADRVANTVLFFASRQTPTNGATLPVDGGLPDATPR